MAKGTKNYFRHSFSAHEDIKLQSFLDHVGPQGYLYFFSLCEIASRQCVENDADPRSFMAKIHPRNLATIWKTQRNKLGMILEHSRNDLGIVSECSENEVSYLIPTLWKYLGSYDSSSPNKIKEKEIKEKKIKKKNVVDFSSFDFEKKFEEIWSRYPKKDGRKDALKHFKASVKSDEDFLLISKALEKYRKKLLEDSTPLKFTKSGSTWFNNWKDSLEISKSPDDEAYEKAVALIEAPWN